MVLSDMEASASDRPEIINSLGPDELCLRPLKRPDPGFSQLCNLCIRVFRERQEGQTRAHVELSSTLEESAKRGCRLCNLIFECFREQIQGSFNTCLSLRYRTFKNLRNLRFESTSMSFYCDINCDHIEPSHYISTSEQNIAGNTLSESNKIMARWWFQRCKDDHPHCTPVGYSGRKLPKRLLEVGISSNGLTVKVIETQPLQDVEYMTLSHCWGGSLPLRLLTTGLEAFRTSIPLSSLPKTFQDALFVVGWFGIKYLWIDALCIIQDSDDDWAHESGRMRDYYKYSFGTIAATGASNPSEGLFFDRNPAFTPAFRAVLSWEGKEKDVLVTAGGSCLEKLREEPLNQRGWFLQERFLSPRILHFGRNHMSWECQTKLSCETWPNIVPAPVYSRSSFALNHKWTMSSDYDVRDSWGKLVSTYSRMALTRLSDRCVAFAGIAEEFQATTRDDYVAGMWRRDLEEGLLWRVDERRYPKDSPARSQSYLAPSWSWLSLDRAVVLLSFDRRARKMVAINAEVESLTENKFGAIRHGVITGWGMLVPVVCAYRYKRWKIHSIRSEIIAEPPHLNYSIYIDEGYIKEPKRFLYCFCLPILENKYETTTFFGLLVAPTLKMFAQYRRIGTFHVQNSEAYDLFKVHEEPNDRLNGPEFQDFTLV